MVDSQDPLSEPVVTKPKRFRFSVRLLLVLTAIACVLLFAGIWVNKKLDEYSTALLVGDPGAVTTSDKWPRALTELIDAASKSGIAVEDLEVHCIQSGWDEEYLWRMKANPRLLDFMKEKYELGQTTPPTWSIFASKRRHYLSDSQAPSWKLPELKDSEYFACPQFMGREPNDRFEMVLDLENDLIVVHYYFDF